MLVLSTLVRAALAAGTDSWGCLRLLPAEIRMPRQPCPPPPHPGPYITAPLPCPRRLPLHSAGDLLQQRASVAANVRRLVAGFREAEAADKAAAAMPSYGSTVTVMSESQVGGDLGFSWGGNLWN